MSLERTLQSADGLLERLDHEGCVSLLTSFLNAQNPAPPLVRLDQAVKDESLVICFACGGSGKRWSGFLGVPKHFVDIGQDVPLIHYSVNQFLCGIEPASLFLLVDRHQHSWFSSIRNVELIDRRGDPEEDVAYEVLDHPSLAAQGTQNILLLMGDVAWSQNAVSQVIKHANQVKALTLFGRSKKNELHGNNGGEIFGAFIPKEEFEHIGVLYELCKKIYHGNTLLGMTRFSTWEVLALTTAAARISGKSSLREMTSAGSNYSIPRLLGLMKNSLDNGEYMQEIWTEIDDETEDFDYPFEYLMWLRRRVRRTGLSGSASHRPAVW